MKLTIAQINYHTGNFKQNSERIIQSIKDAKEQGSDLVLFAELSVCGYPPRDFLLFDEFINQGLNTAELIAKECVGIAAVIGCPVINPVPEGKDLYNAALWLEDGVIKHVIRKTLLPTYDIFDEYRYFESNTHFECITYKGVKFAVTICEDLWNLNDNPMYVKTPLDELTKHQPNCVINIAASPYSKTQVNTRNEVLHANAVKYKLPIFYVNHVGAQTHLVFDGGSCVVNADGNIYDALKSFEVDTKHYHLSLAKNNSLSITSLTKLSEPRIDNKYYHLEKALVLGIRQYFAKLSFNKAILGLSGGIDSALVLYLAVKALGAENVLAVMLPSEFSSEHSITDSEQLVKNLHVKTHTISIENVFNSVNETLLPYFKDTQFDITEENIQSRSRALLLMALSNKFGYILLNTSNKSELAVGYGTLYGDMCGGLSVIGDLYKTEVIELCKFINANGEVIPENIITKPPSAELRPNQKDSDSLPDYEVLDAILHWYIEENKGPEFIVAQGFDELLVQKTLKMVNANEWKRWQAPPTIRVSKRAFGPGRRMPISGKYLN